MYADDYAGFEELYRSGGIQEVACLAHVRRKFFDIAKNQGSSLAADAVGRIAELYAVEDEARGRPPDERVRVRQAKGWPVFDALSGWLQGQLPRGSAQSDLAGANRGLAIGPKNWLFAGSEAGGQTAAVANTPIETAKLNAVAPQAWLTDVLGRIADPPNKQIDQLLPWA